MCNLALIEEVVQSLPDFVDVMWVRYLTEPVIFQYQIKMRTISYCHGAQPVSSVMRREVARLVDTLTSEHNGLVTAILVQGEFGEGKFAFEHNGSVYLGVCQAEYIVILEEGVLNVRQLIFLLDNPIIQFVDSVLYDVLKEYIAYKRGFFLGPSLSP